jgi:flagellar hook-associated protein FlgK
MKEQKTLKNQLATGQVNNILDLIGSRNKKIKSSQNWHKVVDDVENFLLNSNDKNLIELLKKIDVKYDVIFEIDAVLSDVSGSIVVRILSEKRKNILAIGSNNLTVFGYKIIYAEKEK